MACFENFYEKVSETLTGGDSRYDYDCFCYLVFNIEESLTSFKFKNFDDIIKFAYVDNVSKGLLPVNFTKIIP